MTKTMTETTPTQTAALRKAAQDAIEAALALKWAARGCNKTPDDIVRQAQIMLDAARAAYEPIRPGIL